MHFEACIMLYLGLMGDNTWIDEILVQNNYNSIEDVHYIYLYFLSLYTVTQTFCTVGYGDYPATNHFEYFWYMIMELTGVGVFTILTKRS